MDVGQRVGRLCGGTGRASGSGRQDRLPVVQKFPVGAFGGVDGRLDITGDFGGLHGALAIKLDVPAEISSTAGLGSAPGQFGCRTKSTKWLRSSSLSVNGIAFANSLV
jgi:hypothetical protein